MLLYHSTLVLSCYCAIPTPNSIIMPLARLETLEQFDTTTFNSKDGKFLGPAIQAVFAELKGNLDDYFASFESKLYKVIEQQDQRIAALSSQNKKLSDRIDKLEDRLDAEDAYERKDSLIFSGTKIPVFDKKEDVLSLVTDTLKTHLNYVLAPTEISVLHRLQEKKNRNGSPDHRSIYVKFCRRSVRKDILDAARRLKVPEFYTNEALTPTRQTIAFALRKAKKLYPEIVSGSTTQDGKPYVWVYNSTNRNTPGAKNVKHLVHTYHRLEVFCTDTIKKPLSSLIDRWNH